jgi:hypothetical protein
VDQDAIRLTELKEKYQYVVELIQQLGVRVTDFQLRSNKIIVLGKAPSEQVKNRVCEEINVFYSSLTCQVTVE